MFEEARLYRQSEIPISLVDQANANNHSLKLLECEVVRYWHQRHQIYIYQWLATGYVKSKQVGLCKKWVLYSEYKDRRGNNAYIQSTFNSLESALTFAESDALSIHLPEC